MTDILNQDQTTLSQGPGERLRLARQQANLSVSDVASRLRLRLSLIEAIERNDYSNRNVPEPVFVCGYIRSYGKLLDLPKEEVEDIVKTFNQLNLPQFKNDRPTIQLDKTGNIRLGLKGRSIGGFAYLVALAVVVGAVFLWHNSTTQPVVDTEESIASPVTAAVSAVETPATPLIDKNANSLTQTSEPVVNNANNASAPAPVQNAPTQTVDTSINAVPSNVNGNAPSGNGATQDVNSQKNTALTQQPTNLQNNIQPQTQSQNPTQQVPAAAPSPQNPTLPQSEQQLNQSMENVPAKKTNPRISAQERQQQRRANERRQQRLEQQRLRQEQRRQQEERLMQERRQQWY